MATPQEQRRLLQEQRKRLQQKAQQNKPPAIGTKRADGKIYSGQNYGYQSPATHKKLKEQGKFKAGTQAIDRAASSTKNFVNAKLPGVANAARTYRNTLAENARRTALRDSQTTVGKGINAVKAVTNAPAQAKQAAVNYVSDKTNLDPRIVRVGAEVAGGVLKTKAGQGIVKASGGRIAPPGSTHNRSVGAAARPAATAPTRRQLPRANRPGTVPARRASTPKPTSTPGKPLGGQSRRIAFQNTYHGTSARDAASIRANGYRPSATGVFGGGVYSGNRKMAQQYASSAGIRAGDKGAVLRHRVPKKNQINVPFEKPQQGQRVSPQSGLVQQRLRQGKTTRIDYGKGSQVTNLTKGQADKTLVKPNGNIRLSKAQAAKVRAQRGPNSQKLGYDNVAKSEPGYFKPGKGQTRFGSGSEIKSAVQDLRNKRNDGFSVNTGGKRGAKGNYVAIDGKVLRNATPQRIDRFLAQNKDILSRPDAAVGGWVSKRTGKPVLEISRRVPSSKEAQRLAKKFQQEGSYNTRTGQYTGAGGSDQLRHTKGNQTRGGSRIGGQSETTRLKPSNRTGTVRKPVRATTGKTQETKPGNSGRKVNLGKIQRGAKKFTPATRAQAVQRANSRVINVPGYQGRRNNAIGIQSHKTVRGTDNGGFTHDIAFSNSDQKLRTRGRRDPYGSRRDIGEKPKSKTTERLRKAGLKDMMGRMLDVNRGDSVTASPTTKSRGILYNRSSKGALGTRRGEGTVESVRAGPNMWINKEDGGKRVKFDPNSLKEPLTKQTKTQATRVGRAAGGTSKKPALIERPKNTVRNPKAKDTKTRSAAAIRKRQEANLAKARAAKAEKAARRAARTPNSNTIRERQGVVRTTQRSRVSRDQRERTRASTADQHWDNGMTRPRDQAAIQRFTDQRAGGREVDRGGRRTWNGSNETRRLRIRRR